MQGVDYESLSEALQMIRKNGGRGAFADLSRRSGVSESVLGRIAARKQKTVMLDTWRRLYEAEPELIPEPLSAVQPAHQFTADALDAYPIFRDVVKKVNDAAAEGLNYRTVLAVIKNDLDSALMIETNGNGGKRKTG
jgi:hypothetical protein